MQTRDALRRPRLCDVDFDVAQLPVEIGCVDIVLLVEPVGALAASGVLVGREDPEPEEGFGSNKGGRFIGLSRSFVSGWRNVGGCTVSDVHHR